MNEKEIFKTIPNAPNYELSQSGIVRNSKTKRPLKVNDGRVRLVVADGKKKCFYLQDEIDTLFLPTTTESAGSTVEGTEIPAESKPEKKSKRKPLLNVHQVRKIRQMLADGVPHKEIAKRIGEPCNIYLVADIRYCTRKCYNQMR